MNITNKITSVLLTATTAVWLSSFAMFVPVANAQSVTDLQTQINALLSQIAALQSQLANQTGGSGSAVHCTFTRDLTVGVTGNDVMCLQQYLNDGGNSMVSASGAGSRGNESMYFGSRTAAAVAKWQAANGLSPAVGYFGPKSRAKYAVLVAGTTPAPVPTPSPTPVPSGSGLSVNLAADQPAAGLFGKSFASRPFTKLVFSASADGDVTVNSLTVQRTGQGADAAFSGVVALDENGIRLGDSKTFGSDHTLKLSNPFVVKAGQSRIITLAGDSPASQTNQAGQLVSLSLIGVDAGAAHVGASFPLTGNVMTVNDTLSIGNVTITRGPLDPGTSLTEQIGTTGYTFSSLKLTAGSNEDVSLKSFRWYQSGSASATDLANVKVYVDGTAYDTTVSSDGKYYTAVFNPPLTIQKGLSKEASIKGDVVSGTNRTVSFDLYRYNDIQVVGLTYGYTLAPTATDSGDSSTNHNGTLQSSQPNFDGFQVTIGAGTLTVEKAVTVAAQNIAINLSNQVLGGFLADVKGEDVTVAAMNFDLSLVKPSTGSRAIDSNDITNVSLYDENGNVVAGPVDGAAGGKNAIKFTDTVTLKVGRHVYTLKGKLGTDFANNDTVSASTTPSSQWTTVKGLVSSQSITPTGGTITMNTMTVKAAALSVTVAPGTGSAAAAQNVVAGTNNYLFTNYVLDASNSGEDIRLTQMQLRVAIGTANTADDMTNCQLKDGTTALNSGSNIVNPGNSVASADAVAFTFDSSLIIPKGTVKTLGLYCNLTAQALSGQTYGWGLATPSTTNVVATGITSGTTVTPGGTADNGRTITARTAGTLSLALDSSSPSLRWAQSGTTGNTLAVFSLTSTYEDIRVDTIGLTLATTSGNAAYAYGNASNTPQDLSQVTLWVGSQQVGSAVFSGDFATVSLSGVTVPKDSQILLTIKGDIAPIGVGQPAKPGHLVLVNYDSQSSTDNSNRGAVGVGMSSGSTIASGGSNTASNGVRITRANPTITKISTSGKFANTSGQTLYRFSVSAPAGTNGVSLYKYAFEVSTSTTQGCDNSGVAGHTCNFQVTNFRVYCYSDAAFSNAACNAFDNSGLLNQGGLANATVNNGGSGRALHPGGSTTNPTLVTVYFNPTDSTGGSTKDTVRVSAGQTLYFALVGDITGASSSPNVTTKMDGDATFDAGQLGSAGNGNGVGASYDPTAQGDDFVNGRYIFATTAANADGWDDNDFIWSGNPTSTTQSIVDFTWYNGFLVPGLSNSDAGLQETITLQ